MGVSEGRLKALVVDVEGVGVVAPTIIDSVLTDRMVAEKSGTRSEAPRVDCFELAP